MTGSGRLSWKPAWPARSIPGSATRRSDRTRAREQGTLTWSSGSVEGRSDAEIDNSGTFVANASVPSMNGGARSLNEDGSNVWLHTPAR